MKKLCLAYTTIDNRAINDNINATTILILTNENILFKAIATSIAKKEYNKMVNI